MKTIYLVRHGESEGNALGQYNPIDTRLSKRGEVQAAEIAKRCVHLPIKIIVSSTMPRALQTAEVIATYIDKRIETSASFRERISATKILGKKRNDPEAVAVIQASRENFHVPGWRYEDGENFEDLKQRALEGLGYLSKRPEDNILVVSHGFFMYIIAAAVIFGADLTAQECLHIIEGFGELENTALTVVKYRDEDRPKGRSPWQLRVWNDHAHLGQL